MWGTKEEREKNWKIVTTELDHCSFSPSAGASVWIIWLCNSVYKWYALPSDSRIHFLLPSHLIVYICMLEFMLTSFDFFLPCRSSENTILSLLHVSLRPNEKCTRCSLFFYSHAHARTFRLADRIFIKYSENFLRCHRSNRIVMWNVESKCIRCSQTVWRQIMQPLWNSVDEKNSRQTIERSNGGVRARTLCCRSRIFSDFSYFVVVSIEWIESRVVTSHRLCCPNWNCITSKFLYYIVRKIHVHFYNTWIHLSPVHAQSALFALCEIYF